MNIGTCLTPLHMKCFSNFLSVWLPSSSGRVWEACAHVWLGCKQRHNTRQKRKPDICHFIITSNLLLSYEEKGQRRKKKTATPVSSLSSFLLIIHHVEMNWNVVLIPGLMTSYSTNSAVSFSAGWITAMLDNVSAVSVWNDGEPKEK